MKQILLLTHGTFCEGIKNSVELIAGKCDYITTMSIQEDDAPQLVSKRLKEYLRLYSDEDSKLILTDIPGGSTTQGAFPFINDEKNIYVLTGLNLGLLLELVLSGNGNDVVNDVHQAIEHAKSTIQLLNDVMKREEF